MTCRLRIVPIAQRHIDVASEWWRENRTAAPTLFLDELARAFRLITMQPDVAPLAHDVAAPDVRRLNLVRTHYNVYYRHQGDLVEILAVWHSRRGTGPYL